MRINYYKEDIDQLLRSRGRGYRSRAERGPSGRFASVGEFLGFLLPWLRQSWVLSWRHKLWRALVKAAPWIIGLFILGAIAKVVSGQLQSIPRDITRIASQRGHFELQQDAGGELRYKYIKGAIPTSPDEALRATRDALIVENWKSEDIPTQKVAPSVSKSLFKSTDEIWRQYETFSPTDNPSAYAQRLASVAAPQDLRSLAGRVDSIQSQAIGPGKLVGSRPVGKPFAFNVVAVKDGMAYVTWKGVVRYQSMGMGYDNQQAIRSYGAVLAKQGNRWVAKRVAADSISNLLR